MSLKFEPGKWTWLFLLVLIVLVFLVFSYVSVVVEKDKECYEEIARSICGDNRTLFLDLRSSEIFVQNWDFKCCRIQEEPRKITMVWNCDIYNFLEEDDRKCSKKYNHWKRVW